MIYDIYNWADISENFNDSILIGNGASISIDEGFAYGSLRQHAIDNGLMIDDVQRLFEFFETDDFELILRLVWQASKVNTALRIADGSTRNAYQHVRDCLIRAVRSIHPEYHDVEDQFPTIAAFLQPYKTILSLNYDLTLYWIIMFSNREFNGHRFKDCILHGEFDEDWQRFRDSINQFDRETSLVFYPHGSLVFARNIVEYELKLMSRAGNDLLRSILDGWESEVYIPLFVSEGTSKQKISAIHNSHYLNTIYREVLPSLSGSLVIFGWGFGEHDLHILDRLKQSSIQSFAISVHNNNEAYCTRVQQLIREHIGREVEVVFFDSESPGCWNKPAQ